jgi:hypothetical protein
MPELQATNDANMASLTSSFKDMMKKVNQVRIRGNQLKEITLISGEEE